MKGAVSNNTFCTHAGYARANYLIQRLALCTVGSSITQQIKQTCSPDELLMVLDYCWDIKKQRAMQRHKEKSAVVIPVLLRPCDIGNADFMQLQGLPKNLKPVTKWPNQDEAFTDIARGIRDVAYKIRTEGIRNSPLHRTKHAQDNLFTVPFADDHFIGRKQELTRLNELFLTSSKVALTGLGGVCKERWKIMRPCK